MPDNSRFFIVGSGRSGSTLLRLQLSAHSRLYVTPETWFIMDLVRRFPLCQQLSPSQAREAVDFITSDYRWPDMQIEARDLQRWAAQLAAPTLVAIIDLAYNRLLKVSGKVRLGDKTPPYIAIVPELAALYPDAKFIHLIRDGRDVAISYIELGYDSGTRYYDGGRFEWIAAMRNALSYRGTELADRILEVGYEEFVGEPESTLRAICSFLGEHFEPQMLQAPAQIEAVPERERYIHPRLAQPISDDRAAVWRGRLSGFECFCMEACLRRYLVAFDYPLRFARSVWWPLLVVAEILLRGASPLLDRAVPYLGRRNYLPKRFYF